jgi:hypothetical protein
MTRSRSAPGSSCTVRTSEPCLAHRQPILLELIPPHGCPISTCLSRLFARLVATRPMKYWTFPARMYNSISSLRHLGAWKPRATVVPLLLAALLLAVNPARAATAITELFGFPGADGQDPGHLIQAARYLRSQFRAALSDPDPVPCEDRLQPRHPGLGRQFVDYQSQLSAVWHRVFNNADRQVAANARVQRQQRRSSSLPYSGFKRCTVWSYIQPWRDRSGERRLWDDLLDQCGSAAAVTSWHAATHNAVACDLLCKPCQECDELRFGVPGLCRGALGKELGKRCKCLINGPLEHPSSD